MNATGGEVVLCASRPAVHHNGPVACFALHLGHFINGINNSLHVGALSIRSPVLDVELSHLVGLPRLESESITQRQINKHSTIHDTNMEMKTLSYPVNKLTCLVF